jgi:hypothetical protein
MLLGRTKGADDTAHFSKNPSLGTDSSAEPQLSTVEKSISDFQLTGNAIARLLPPRERSLSLSVTGPEDRNRISQTPLEGRREFGFASREFP